MQHPSLQYELLDCFLNSQVSQNVCSMMRLVCEQFSKLLDQMELKYLHDIYSFVISQEQIQSVCQENISNTNQENIAFPIYKYTYLVLKHSLNHLLLEPWHASLI